MATETVFVDWIRDQSFLLSDRFGFPILMAQPMGVHGADLLPLSLIGCAAWDVIAILHKQRQQVTGLRVTAESEQEPEPPWRFKKIRIHYRFSGRNLRSDQIRRAIELTETKYCSTYATLRTCIEILTEFEVVDQ
jgi:putative redox protein